MRIIKLNKGYETKVDDEAYERLSKFKWVVSIRRGGKPYAVRKFYNSYYPLSYEVLKLKRCDLPYGHVVDHEDRDSLNNQKANLRIISHQDNIINSDRVINSKGYRKVNGRYYACWRTKYFKGSVTTEEEAIALVKLARG